MPQNLMVKKLDLCFYHKGKTSERDLGARHNRHLGPLSGSGHCQFTLGQGSASELYKMHFDGGQTTPNNKALSLGEKSGN